VGHGVDAAMAGRLAKVIDGDDETLTISVRVCDEDARLRVACDHLPEIARLEVHAPPALTGDGNALSPPQSGIRLRGR
jgi:hypothetical protein